MKIILGNKLDLENKREVQKEVALEYAKSINCEYFEVSAVTGENIHESFEFMAKKIISNFERIFLQVVLVVKNFFFICCLFSKKI
jgi:GTPase SAR1 family protein